MSAPRILVVEDNASVRDLFVTLLEEEGYAVTQAKSGLEALRCVALEAPDLLVLNYGLPDLDGLEVLRRLRAQGAQYPIIMTSGGTTKDIVEAAARFGAYAFLILPSDLDPILALVADALAGMPPPPSEDGRS